VVRERFLILLRLFFFLESLAISQEKMADKGCQTEDQTSQRQDSLKRYSIDLSAQQMIFCTSPTAI
jgi:hypothetical protein